MKTTFLFAVTVFIWGTTWYGIKLQLGHAPDEISVFYRAVLAALILFFWCYFKKISLKFSLIDHFFFCLLGLSLFSLHYLFIYNATNYIVSGFVAVVGSIVSFLSIANNYIFFQERPKIHTIAGAIVGVFGLCLIFWSELEVSDVENTTLKGFMLSAVGILIFSFGAPVSTRNNRCGIDILPAMTFGMIYGALIILIFILVRGSAFALPESTEYWLSLLYLVIPGSIIAFMCYLKLIKDVGSELAGYTMVLFPVVALIISSVFEGYQWSFIDVIGIFFVLMGNVLVMSKHSLSKLKI